MSRTARCILVGFSVTLAAACGDDDTITAVGGGGGAAGSAGSAGSSGSSGAAGAGGSAGSAGSGGASGAGAGGTAGTGAGAGGAAGTGGAGTGGTGGAGVGGTGGVGGVGGVPDDAGAPDADVVPDAAPADGGTNGDCPANLETTLSDDIVAGNGQDVAIARVIFRTTPEVGVTVVFKNVSTTPFVFGNTPILCSGALNFCTDVSDLDPLPVGGEIARFLPDTDVEGGEIALLSLDGSFVAVYAAWGEGYESQEVTGDFDDDPNTPDTTTPNTLEEIAVATGGVLWTADERIAITAPQNTIFGVAGDQTDSSDGFDVCTGDGDVAGQ